jgi:hypothetical protein
MKIGICMIRQRYCEVITFHRTPVGVNSVAEPHYFYAAADPGKNFDAAPAALAPAPTLVFRMAKF